MPRVRTGGSRSEDQAAVEKVDGRMTGKHTCCIGWSGEGCEAYVPYAPRFPKTVEKEQRT